MQHPSGDPSRPLDDIADAARLLQGQPGFVGAPELSEAYGRSSLILMVKDPHSLFTYWEYSPKERDGALADHTLWLRVYETDPTGREIHPLEERLQVGATGSYHLHVPQGGRHYLTRLENAHGEPLLTSNVVTTPPGRPAESSDVTWLSQGAFTDWFQLTPGGPSSPGLAGAIEGRWLTAGAGGSPMSHPPRLLRRLEVKLVVTGQAAPGVTITAMGAPVDVRPDGAFAFAVDLQGETLTLAIRLEENGGQWETSLLSLERLPRNGHAR